MNKIIDNSSPFLKFDIKSSMNEINDNIEDTELYFLAGINDSLNCFKKEQKLIVVNDDIIIKSKPSYCTHSDTINDLLDHYF